MKGEGCYPECPDRSITCHSDCERYKKQSEDYEKARQERHKEIAVLVYEIDQKNKAISARRNHKAWKRGERK